jgi:hypothetical protein
MTPCFQNMNRRGLVRRRRKHNGALLLNPKEARRGRAFRFYALKDQLDLLVVPARANRKHAHSNPSRLERDDAAILQGVNKLGQVREQRSRQYVRLPAALAAKLDDGWLSRRTRREQHSEIDVRRQQNSTLDSSALEDRIVVRVLQTY